MSIAIEKTPNFASAIGTPTDDTVYDKVDLGSVFTNLKIIVTGAPLGFSIDGRTDNGLLPVGEHDFLGIRVSEVFLRKTASTVNLYGYAVDK